MINLRKDISGGDGNWKVFTSSDPCFFNTKIYITRFDGVKRQIARFNKDGEMELRDIIEGALDPLPTLTLPDGVWQLIVDAISEITPPRKKEVVEAELAATKYHLEDFRKLIFDKKKVEEE